MTTTGSVLKAKNNLDVYGYKEYQVDLTQPTLILTHNNNRTITASGADSPQDYRYYLYRERHVCGGDLFITPLIWNHGSTTSTLQAGQWVCFAAKNRLGVWGYAETVADFRAPVLTITQDADSLDASATAPTDTTLADSSWAHSGFLDSSPTCSDTSITYETAGSSEDKVAITSSNNGQWVCFKVKNNLGVYGYKEHQIDFSPPVITITQDQDSLAASATVSVGTLVDSSWAHSDFLDTSPTCADNSITYQTAGADEDKVAITSSHNGKWVCFKVKNNFNIYGYASIRITYATPPATTVVITAPSLDLTAPQLVLQQKNDTVAASGSNLSGFKYFVSNDNPDCSQANRQALYNSGALATGLLDRQWVCFSAQYKEGVWVYKKLLVDLSRPTLEVVQFAQTLTASGDNLNNYQYLKTNQQTNCVPQKSNLSWTFGQKVSGLSDQEGVCFKAQNRLGVFGYAFQRVDLSPPTLHLSLNGSSVTASGQDLKDYQYLKTFSKPDCAQSSNSYQSGQTARLTNGQWVCFKAQNRLGLWGYIQMRFVLEETPLETETIGGTPSSDLVSSDQTETKTALSAPNTFNSAGPQSPFESSFTTTQDISNDLLSLAFALLAVLTSLFIFWRLLVARRRSPALKSLRSPDAPASNILGNKTVDELYDEMLSRQFSELIK